VPDIGTYGGPPDEWRQGLEKVRDMLCITSLGQGSLTLQALWKEKFEQVRLVEIPEKPAQIVDIETFMGSQMNILEASVGTLQDKWLHDFVRISVEGNVWAETPHEAQYFEQVAALLSSQLRSGVETSLLEYRAFWERFAGEPMDVATAIADDVHRQRRADGCGGAPGRFPREPDDLEGRQCDLPQRAREGRGADDQGVPGYGGRVQGGEATRRGNVVRTPNDALRRHGGGGAHHEVAQ
jgi:hypothetical protein